MGRRFSIARPGFVPPENLEVNSKVKRPVWLAGYGVETIHGVVARPEFLIGAGVAGLLTADSIHASAQPRSLADL